MDAPAIQYVTTSDGVNMAYSVSGEGRPFVLAHAPFSNIRARWDSKTYGPPLEALAGRFKLIQFDCRGEGMSTRGLPDDLSLDHYERDIEAAIDVAGPGPVVLYAPAVMGHAAIRYAARRPERLLGLILVHVNLDDPLEGIKYLEDVAKVSWENFLKIPAAFLYHLDPPARAVEILRETMAPADFLKKMRLQAPSVRHLLPSLRVPVLVIAIRGAYGPQSTGEDQGMAIASLVPGSKLVVLNPGLDSFTTSADFAAGLPEASNEAPVVAGDSPLSAREVEVLRLIASGRSNPQIADELVISLNTVQRHVSNIFAKIDAANRVEATIYARDRGIA